MPERLPLLIDRTETPIGELVIVADSAGRLRAVDWSDYEARMMRLLRRQYGLDGFALTPADDPSGLTSALSAYFAGALSAIDALPVETVGTPFQRQVWGALRGIPAGTTLSYAALARRIGRPAAVRAVGAANGANYVNVVVPCHRLISSTGDLTGYGSGIERKRWLLAHEARAAG
jgi:methylated-DNA-[protein]-cysteine S-methyltransferase